MTLLLPEAPELKISCQCPNGKYRCHHMAAVALHIKDNVSKTDTECSWTNPHKNPRLLESSVFQLHQQYSSIQIPEDLILNPHDKGQLLLMLHPMHAHSLVWLCSPQESSINVSILTSNTFRIKVISMCIFRFNRHLTLLGRF